MGVASHLHINLAEYDSRIRSFIPDYEEMLAAAAGVLSGRERVVVDLGVGTGALAKRCLERAPQAGLVGIDSDPAMIAVARRRLGPRAQYVAGSFLRMAIPTCDAAVAALSLHHVRTRPAKARLYARLRSALRPSGVLVSADCHPSRHPAEARRQRDAWVDHLRRSYTVARAEKFLWLWAQEDVYVPLHDELRMLHETGYMVEVVWRRGPFAVISARPAGRRS